MEIQMRHLWIIILISRGARFTDGESVIVRETGTARFRWQVPRGTSVLAMYVLNPNGTRVLLIYRQLVRRVYEARVNYTRDLSPGLVSFDMSNVSRSDAGTYTCSEGGMTDIISNCGQTLIVLGEPTKPVISLQSTPVVGRNVTMTCSSSSTTLPADHGLTFTYTWKIDGLNITSPDGASLTVPVESHDPQGITCHVTEDKGLGRDSDVLMLTPDYIVEETDYGVFYVNVTNTLGRFRIQFQIGKEALLFVPENFQCQNKAGSYILQWTPGGDDETRGVGFLVEQRLPQANWTTVSATVESDGMMRQVQLPDSGDRTVFFRLYATEGAARTSPVTASCTAFTVAVDKCELSFGAGVGVGLVVAVAAAAVCLAVVCICRKKRLSLKNDPSRQKEEESVYHEVGASTVTTQHSRQQHRQSGAGTSGSTYDALTSDRDTPTEAPTYEKLEKQYVNMAVSADDET